MQLMHNIVFKRRILQEAEVCGTMKIFANEANYLF